MMFSQNDLSKTQSNLVLTLWDKGKIVCKEQSDCHER